MGASPPRSRRRTAPLNDDRMETPSLVGFQGRNGVRGYWHSGRVSAKRCAALNCSPRSIIREIPGLGAAATNPVPRFERPADSLSRNGSQDRLWPGLSVLDTGGGNRRTSAVRRVLVSDRRGVRPCPSGLLGYGHPNRRHLTGYVSGDTDAMSCTHAASANRPRTPHRVPRWTTDPAGTVRCRGALRCVSGLSSSAIGPR